MQPWQVGVLVVVVAAVVAAITWWLCCPSRLTSSTSLDARICGYSVWRYDKRHNNWVLVENRIVGTHVANPPPADPTLTDGYCIKVVSRPLGG